MLDATSQVKGLATAIMKNTTKAGVTQTPTAPHQPETAPLMGKQVNFGTELTAYRLEP